ncbi:MAG: hypothetical protein KKA28_11035 [Planctomycetes bacterium]|nr:hypothetical protein [Planctomycetota bacterium]
MMAALVVIGCGRPQASTPQNQKLISSLRTAISAKKTVWLEKCNEILQDRRAEGKVTDAEYEEFQAIIALAKEKRWKEAEQEVIRFQKAQRPIREKTK